MTATGLSHKSEGMNSGGKFLRPKEVAHKTDSTERALSASLPVNRVEIAAGDDHNAAESTPWVNKIVRQAVQSVDNWSDLQKNIRSSPDRVKNRMKEIEKQFSVYRLTYASILYKASTVEEDIWGVFSNIIENIPRLEQRTKKRPLFLYTNSGLRDLNQAWENLSSLQDALSRLLDRGPRKLEFYNRMLIYREDKRQVDVQRRQNETRINSAYESVKKALNFVERQTKDDQPIFFGNEILTLDDAKSVWTGSIESILQLRDNRTATTETIVGRLRGLEESIRDYPTLSKQVQRTGERFQRMISYHDLLVSTGKRVVPQPEIARASVMMFEQIPEFWTTGNYAELKVTLERVENFLNFYESTVELEVAVGERRRTGFAQGMAPPIMAGATGLSPLIGLARVLVSAIDQRDRFMVGHSEQVADLALATGRKLNWSASDLEFLELAALLHDIGKISIPESLLTKVKPLSNDDWDTIHLHPYYGAQIIRQVNQFARIVPWVYHHQERWDGTGYPDQLSKQEIPQAASIISIAESFSAMTLELPYRNALSRSEALQSIKAESGTQFDPEVVEAFSESLPTEADKPSPTEE
ncbi:MAG: HD domain-containing protein [Chloroflexi bacterium]|nr:MAG: HD domain-containing protein [Chloroflexota bacterium]